MENTAPKFKIGDMVRILDGKDIYKYYGGWCIGLMGEHIGEIHKIVKVEEGHQTYKKYGYVLNNVCYTWDERGLELVEDNQEFHVGDVVELIDNPYKTLYFGAKIEKMMGKQYKIIQVKNAFETVELLTDTRNNYNWFPFKSVKLIKAANNNSKVVDKVIDKEDDNKYNVELHNIYITVENNHTVTATMGERKGVAKCHPEDKFDLDLGMLLAIARMIGNDKKEKEEKENITKRYYSGKVVCVKKSQYGNVFTQGKIYEIKNGVLTDDNGRTYSEITCVEDINNQRHEIISKFIEVVE